MARVTKSMRGQEVDFDLMEIKSSIENKSKPVEVRDREDFIHTTKRRKSKSKRLSELAQKESKNKEKTKEAAKTRNVSKEKQTPKTQTNKTSKKKTTRKIIKKEKSTDD